MLSAAISPKATTKPKAAVTAFLRDMTKVAKGSFDDWHQTLIAGIEECALSTDQRRAVLEIHPLDDYFFAGVVALEASKIRTLFAPEKAGALLSELAEHVDVAAGRNDRVVSDLVFSTISRIELMRGTDKTKMPHDQVVKAILQRLGIDQIEATQHLMTETLYRHTFGEPLALGVPAWWQAFQSKYKLHCDVEVLPAEIKTAGPRHAPESITSMRKPRRAVAF
jgi:hypothetical protein